MHASVPHAIYSAMRSLISPVTSKRVIIRNTHSISARRIGRIGEQGVSLVGDVTMFSSLEAALVGDPNAMQISLDYLSE